MAIEAGQTFGPYLLEQKLSRQSGMGSVFQARHIEENWLCALKVIRDDLVGRPVIRARFAREARILRALNHPNIVPILDSGEVDGVAYIATKFVLDGDLLTFIGGELVTKNLLSILRQTAEGLEAAHEAGVVHRDVKPPNLLVERNGDTVRILLADFGVAGGEGFGPRYTRFGDAIGSPEFMSPECGVGKKADRRADVFSLAQCLVVMIGPAARGPITAVITKATSPYPDERHPTVMDFYAEAAAALGSSAVQPPPPSIDGLAPTRLDTPVKAKEEGDSGDRVAVVEAALERIGLAGQAQTSRLARGRSDPRLVTALLVVEGVQRFRPHASAFAADLAQQLGVDRVRLVLLPPGQGLEESVRSYFALIFADHLPAHEISSLTARRTGELLQVDLSPRLKRLCDEDALVPLVAHLGVKEVQLNPIPELDRRQ